MVAPAHTCAKPEMGTGVTLTVIAVVRWQPVDSMYVIEAIPGAMPLTNPLIASMVAVGVAPLTHTPPEVLLVSDTDCPAHT
jgi:hypothetical protein